MKAGNVKTFCIWLYQEKDNNKKKRVIVSVHMLMKSRDEYSDAAEILFQFDMQGRKNRTVMKKKNRKTHTNEDFFTSTPYIYKSTSSYSSLRSLK